MVTAPTDEPIRALGVQKEILITAPIDIAFEALLEELGPASETPDGKSLAMVLEAWPGGRWFRDLGENTGHLWGHVQVIKPPNLLELCGPLFMSYACNNHVQYRLSTDGVGTRLTVHHRAIGPISDAHREGVVTGWEHGLKRIAEIAGAMMRDGRKPHS